MLSDRGRRHTLRSLVLMAGLITATTGCGPGDLDPSKPEAITNRPQNYDHFIALLRLKTPALLEGAYRDGKVNIDPERRARITNEQEDTVAALRSLSQDVEVLYRYRMVLNGLAVVAPKKLEDEFRDLSAVAYVEEQGNFQALSSPFANGNAAGGQDLTSNSMTFIGAEKVRETLTVKTDDGSEVPVDGRGVQVGIIDTGVDYTHAMFGGAGTPQAYESNNPNEVEKGTFPTERVVAGRDFVGTTYNSHSPDFDDHIPQPDGDPLDEQGHGTHVAGTVAGIGDGENTYTGAAPKADLVALKVFGESGATGDAVIIKALEWAADPNQDGQADDRLDILNLSLGSDFGKPHILYNEAVENLGDAGVAVVAAAGNSGADDYIVGAPSTADAAVSVAASVDAMPHNWKFSAVAFKVPGEDPFLAEAVEASFTIPIEEAGDVSGHLVHLGLADKELTDKQKQAVNGNVALIDRGKVTFVEKIQRAADAGAAGVVVANNEKGDPLIMGGDGAIEIPAIMITQTLGETLKGKMKSDAVEVDFQTNRKIEKPELIDSLASFSSRGPRSIDGGIKPEISAPGQAVISARMGSGNEGKKASGTSMATPHVAGVLALLKQMHPELSVGELKAKLMLSAKTLEEKDVGVYPVSRQGAGRIQSFEAATTPLAVVPPKLALGEIPLETGKVVRRTLTVTNTSETPIDVELEPKLDEGLSVDLPSRFSLEPGQKRQLTATVTINPPRFDDASLEMDGFLAMRMSSSDKLADYRIPVLAVANRRARIGTSPLAVMATSPADAAGAFAELTVTNRGQTAGEALVFNLLGRDERKKRHHENRYRRGVCDLQSAGYRVLQKGDTKLLQIAVKLFRPVTSWHLCEASILIDGNGDGKADQELLGTYYESLSNNGSDTQKFLSALTDAETMRSIRRNYEQNYPDAPRPSYEDAVQDAQPFRAFDHSTLAVVTADLEKVSRAPSGALHVKVAVLGSKYSPLGDDFLKGGGKDSWHRIQPSPEGMALVGMPESTKVPAGEEKTIQATKGETRGRMIVYFPHNRTTRSPVETDDQSKILKESYEF